MSQNNWFSGGESQYHVDIGWLKEKPLGYVVGKMRERGTFYAPAKTVVKDGRETHYPACFMHVEFVPDLNDTSRRYEILTAWSNKDTESEPYQNYVLIREWDGETRLMRSDELSRYLDKRHWAWIRETPEDRHATMAAGKAAFESLVSQVKTL